MELKILYEDEFILAIDKPSGLLVHTDGRQDDQTLADWISKNYPELQGVGEEQVSQNGKLIKRPGIVHRLDKETSGVIVIAKTQEAHAFLKEQFQNRKIEKIYHAVVSGVFSEDPSTGSAKLTASKMSGVIDKPIGRSTSGNKWSAEFGAKGEMREAVTEYRVLAQTDNPPNPLYIKGGTGKNQNQLNFSYLEVRPKTGRTHQIRVHLKSISHPVLCDKVYGTKDSLKIGEKLGFSRLALHALSIKLELPNGMHIKIESPLPQEFERVLNMF